MFCGKCGKEAEEGVLFCGGCGWNLAGEPAAGFVSAQTARPISEFSEFLNRKITLKMIHMLIGAAGFLVMIIIVIVLAVSNNSRPYETAVSGRRNDREEDSGRVTDNGDRGADDGGRVGDDGESSTTGTSRNAAQITQAVERFGGDLNNCMDLSVFLDGGELDFSPVRKHFDSSSAYSYMESIEDIFNEQFYWFGYLDFATDIAGNALGALFSGVPIFGDALAKMSDQEIRNDPLLDRSLWASMVRVRVETDDIEVSRDGDSASLILTLTFDVDGTGFRNSRILSLIDDLDGFAVRTSESFELDAEMVRKSDGTWVFTELDGLGWG